MLLYHGTNVKYLQSILTDGITPRKINRNSNWKHTTESLTRHVYLTTAYACYYALSSTKDSEHGIVVEVDSNKLNQGNFYPDEDFIAQVLHRERGYRDEQSLIDLTKEVARHIEEYKANWQKSLEGLGTCSYRGCVPLKAITRYVEIDFAKRPDLAIMAGDPTITIMNYMILGKSKYGQMMKWLFGDIPTLPLSGTGHDEALLNDKSESVQKWIASVQEQSMNRQGIKVTIL